MNIRQLKKALLAPALLSLSLSAQAGFVDPQSTLLDKAGSELLEGWLGQGDLYWSSEWYGGMGATSQSWHSVADTLTHTVSIYQAVNAYGQDVLVGGYTVNNWSGHTYKTDASAFIFNLTQPEYQANTDTRYSTYNYTNYFATFGSGHDLFGGDRFIGSAGSGWGKGYVRSDSYDMSKGTIDVGDGDSGNHSSYETFTVKALETYTFSAVAPAGWTGDTAQSQATSVPIAFTGLLSLAGLAFARRQQLKSKGNNDV